MNIQAADRLGRIPKYAFAEINEAKAKLLASGVDVIDFGVGDPSEPTPLFVREALKVAVDRHASTGYPDYSGSKDFLAACARYMKKTFGVELDPLTEICSNIGGKEAVFNFPEAFVNPGDVVICPSPGYPPYKSGTIFAEGEPFYVPLLPENDFLIDYEAIPAEICERAKIIWINYPNSPTGAVATREYYGGLTAWARKHGIIIAADEGCYIDIYFAKGTSGKGDLPRQVQSSLVTVSNHTAPAVASSFLASHPLPEVPEKPISILEVAREGVVVFYSLSKRNNMTGYRVGFVAGDERIIGIYKGLKPNIDSGTPNFIQDAAIVALEDEVHRAEMCELYEEKAAVLAEALRGIGLEVNLPSATFYVWQKVPEGMTDVEFAKKLLDPAIGVVVTPGSLISDPCLLADGSVINPGAGFVRFALMPKIEKIKELKNERMKKF